ncbi:MULTISPECIES: hypothetical protein [Mycobacterium]|uniref:Uncharacterized protein n=1 Tax=Mycobacterium palustre TaxID=153971 RepID=A0A1X1ZI44_9MYCO|nr:MULTISPECIES: hypothetical protein [Mycobacterium]MCV7260996.1 hypothetical protein [Mycobacterium shimoidei]ODR13588.1 hypothetical protein BHQ16_09610 [Mycobacterium shimoidei]ORW22978.1 hypothetical protein AWC19_12455 [Mycobacterium palustre]ORW76499.1 hypothetical protein AWC26_20860 [Mycobacterium shimoidei]
MTIENFSGAVEGAFATGNSAYGPGFDSREVIARYGEEDGGALIEKIQSLMQEAMRMDVDWTKYDLAGSQANVASRLRENHPELTPEATEWFGRYFSFQNR